MDENDEPLWITVVRTVLYVMWVVFDHLTNANVLVLVGYMMLVFIVLIYLLVVNVLVYRQHNETQNKRMRTSDEWNRNKTVEGFLNVVVRQGGFFKQEGEWAPAIKFNEVANNDKGRILCMRTRKRFSLAEKSVVVIAVDTRTYSISFEDCCLAMCLACNVFLIVQLEGREDMETEKANFLELAKNVVNRSFGVPDRRVIFCHTRIGRIAVARQLKPQLLIENNTEAVRQLAKHVRSTVLVKNFVTLDEKRQVGTMGVVVIERYGNIFDLTL